MVIGSFKTEGKRGDAIVELNWGKGPKPLFKVEGIRTVQQFCAHLAYMLRAMEDSRLEESGFYCLACIEPSIPVAAHLPLMAYYIGKAYGQTLRDRISQKSGHEVAYQCIIDNCYGKQLLLNIANISRTNLEKETEELYNDIECCLIYENRTQPLCNRNCVQSYSGSGRKINITNSGVCYPLKKECACKG